VPANTTVRSISCSSVLAPAYPDSLHREIAAPRFLNPSRRRFGVLVYSPSGTSLPFGRFRRMRRQSSPSPKATDWKYSPRFTARCGPSASAARCVRATSRHQQIRRCRFTSSPLVQRHHVPLIRPIGLLPGRPPSWFTCVGVHLAVRSSASAASPSGLWSIREGQGGMPPNSARAAVACCPTGGRDALRAVRKTIV
jgi:hypothetical protein